MNDNSNDWTRRNFLATTTGAGIAFFLNPFTSWVINDIDPKVLKIIAKTISIDTHNHIDVPFIKADFNARNYNLMEELKKSGLSAICMTFCVDRPSLTKEGEAYERFIMSLDEMDETLKINNLKRALNLSDIQKSHKNKTPIIIQSVEGGHFIEGKVERIAVAYNRGLRHLGLMHDGQTLPAMGDIYTDKPQYGGLTELGKNVIKECNRLGILVDLAHCNNDAVNNALEVSTKPMLISHTGLNTQLGNNERMAKMMMPRLISNEQAKIFANAGGVIGVWTHIADTPTDYAMNIRAMVDVVGIDHVCIGTDTKIATAPSTNERMNKTTNQSWDSKDGFLYTIVDAMLKLGFTETEIIKISGDNYCRIFDKATSI
ncbi:membrane dipeptidase [Flavobacterium sp. SUN052]|uniref:dipeptidase n=1 Tax=Flavobacterium sp. SUN052 TaxID=3002441 RepID=UPI00237DBFA6|nr:membrane dipeptidase [Flavobacterium sp. SUN052]MEC4005347.1 membrane dipeptidase [Flavobacterium sp. SUN052]